MALRVLRVSHSGVVDAWRERERRLPHHGVDVHLITARSWDEFGTEVALRPRPGEPVTGIRTWGRHPALFVYDPRALWLALGQEWDLLDVHEEPFALATAEVLLLRRARRLAAPYLLYSAQNIPKRYPIPFRWLERWALRGAAGMSVCNAEAGRIVVAKGFPAVPSVIPLGIDPDHFQPASTQSVGGEPGTESPPRVGYAGRLAQHKGVDVLLRAIARTDRLTLRVAGEGPERASLAALAADLRIDDRVEFLGAVTQDDLPGFYRSVDVLAVPSLTTPGWIEQFGRVAVEAMACGVPVVASDSGALSDVVSGAGLLVPPGDAVALAFALERVVDDPELAAHLRTAGAARAATAGWDRVTAAYARLYHLATHAAAADSEPGRPIDVIVVAYGAADLVRDALTPLVGTRVSAGRPALAITVVDNSSSQEVAAVCADLDVPYVDPGHNGGFAAGVNEGLRRRRHDGDVLLLNPDAQIDVDGITRLQQALLAEPDLASVGPRQINGAGLADRVGWPFPSPARAWLEAVGLGRLRARTDYVIGSILLLRREAVAQVGGLDESFFLYAEETDWARRAAFLGWRHLEVGTVVARHLGAATSSDLLVREQRFHAAQERYQRKHFGAIGWQVARTAVLAGSAVRALALPGVRGAAARQRLRLYVRGPIRSALQEVGAEVPTATVTALRCRQGAGRLEGTG